MYYRVFDTIFLLSKGPDPLRTYWVQTLHHGFALASAGLPQDMACSLLMHAVLEAFLDLSKRGDLAPTQTIIWVKGTQKTALVTWLVTTPGLPCPFLVREFRGGGLSKSEGAGTSGSWPAPYTGKSTTFQHLASLGGLGLRPSW